MWCKNCGKEVEDNAIFCRSCGENLMNGHGEQSQSMYDNYHQFYEKYAIKSLKNEVKGLWIASYVLAGAMVLLTILQQNFGGMIDVTIYLVCGIVIQKTKKWGATLAVSLAVLPGLSLSVLGGNTGWLAMCVFVIGGMCTVSLKKLSKAFVEHKATGILPAEPIDVWKPFGKRVSGV